MNTNNTNTITSYQNQFMYNETFTDLYSELQNTVIRGCPSIKKEPQI